MKSIADLRLPIAYLETLLNSGELQLQIGNRQSPIANQ
jgi:hypothetical protein